jgi:hypothetical protein
MNDYQANAATQAPPAPVAVPMGHPYVVAAPVTRTSWAALTLAFLAGGFTCFVTLCLVAVVGVVCVSALGNNANSTFQSVGKKVGESNEPTFKRVAPALPAPPSDTFKKVSDQVKGTERDLDDPKDERPFDKH